MIAPVILLMALACGHGGDVDSAPDASAAWEPSFGAWTVTMASTWGGDCALEDTHTWLPAEQTWVLEDDRYGFAVRDEVGYRVVCVLQDRDFVCALPVVEDDLRDDGYDLYATYTPTWSGSFSDETHLSGLYSVAATCEGADCDLLTGFGPDYSAPCTAEASLSAWAVGAAETGGG